MIQVWYWLECCQILSLLMRFRRFLKLSIKVNKTSALTFFPKYACLTLTLGTRDMTKATETEFSRQLLAFFPRWSSYFFEKIPIGCISFHNKDVNSRAIKHFKGRKQLRQWNFLVHTLLYVIETVFSPQGPEEFRVNKRITYVKSHLNKCLYLSLSTIN